MSMILKESCSNNRVGPAVQNRNRNTMGKRASPFGDQIILRNTINRFVNTMRSTAVNDLLRNLKSLESLWNDFRNNHNTFLICVSNYKHFTKVKYEDVEKDVDYGREKIFNLLREKGCPLVEIYKEIDLYEKSNSLINAMAKITTNVENIRENSLAFQLNQLESLWDEFCCRHQVLMKYPNTEGHDYFVKKVYDSVEVDFKKAKYHLTFLLSDIAAIFEDNQEPQATTNSEDLRQICWSI